MPTFEGIRMFIAGQCHIKARGELVQLTGGRNRKFGLKPPCQSFADMEILSPESKQIAIHSFIPIS